MSIIPTPEQPNKRVHHNEESALQAKCWTWLWNEYPETRGLYFAVQNENSRSVYESKKQQLVSGAMRKAIGVYSGVSDTILLLPRGKYNAACIEFKTRIGRQSPKQADWQQKVESVGYYYTIVRSEDEFKEKMKWYINLGTYIKTACNQY